MKNILVLNGSPRVNGNTQELIKSFIQGAKENGNNVSKFDVAFMNIHGCLGCFKGGKDINSPCVQKDDMEQIYKAYRESDLVVFASPMYYWSITGQLKCVFERLFAVAECDINYKNPIKDCMLLMAAEGDDDDNFEPVKDYFLALINNLEWENKGIVYAGGNLLAKAILEKPNQLKEAYELGKSIK